MPVVCPVVQQLALIVLLINRMPYLPPRLLLMSDRRCQSLTARSTRYHRPHALLRRAPVDTQYPSIFEWILAA